MRFARTQKEDPEINLIPMIDVLLVIIIFLMLTTTYSRFAELKITAVELASAAKPCGGAMSVSRLPIVRMIRHPQHRCPARWPTRRRRSPRTGELNQRPAPRRRSA